MTRDMIFVELKIHLLMGYCRWNVFFIAFDELAALSSEFRVYWFCTTTIVLLFRFDNDQNDSFKYGKAYGWKLFKNTMSLTFAQPHIGIYLWRTILLGKKKQWVTMLFVWIGQDNNSLQLNNVIFLVLVCCYVTAKDIECVCE